MIDFLRQKKKEPEPSEALFLSEKELWLMKGEFRDWYTDENKRGYYGICSCSTESIYPPGEKSGQDQFYKLVYCMTKELLQTAPSVVFIEDISRSDAWKERKDILRQLALGNGGKIFEESDELKDSYAFVFPALPDSFFEEVYWWMAEHACKEDIYVQYSVLEDTARKEASIAAIKENARLNVLVDDIHPVFILQLAETNSMEEITDVLSNTCNREGWTLSLK